MNEPTGFGRSEAKATPLGGPKGERLSANKSRHSIFANLRTFKTKNPLFSMPVPLEPKTTIPGIINVFYADSYAGFSDKKAYISYDIVLQIL